MDRYIQFAAGRGQSQRHISRVHNSVARGEERTSQALHIDTRPESSKMLGRHGLRSDSYFFVPSRTRLQRMPFGSRVRQREGAALLVIDSKPRSIFQFANERGVETARLHD